MIMYFLSYWYYVPEGEKDASNPTTSEKTGHKENSMIFMSPGVEEKEQDISQDTKI